MWIEKSISPEQRQRVHDLGEPGLLFGPRETRLYPNGMLAAHVLGGASFGREGVHAAEVDRHRRRRARLRRAPARPGAGRRAAAALHRPQGADRPRGRAGPGHGGDARQGRGRHPDGSRHRPDPRARQPPRLRPQRPPAAADLGRSRRQPALQPRGAGALRARLGLQALHRRHGARGGPRLAADARRFEVADALRPLHHPRLPQLRRAAHRRGRAGEVLEHRRRPYRHDPRRHPPAGVLQADRPPRRLAGRARRGRPHRPPPAAALDRPLHHHHLLRPRHGGDAAAPRRRLRHAWSTAACASTRASSPATRARPRPTG